MNKMNFTQALDKMLEGGRITRLEWKDEGVYGFMLNGRLSIRMNAKYHDWILSDGDIKAEDWVVI